MVQADASHADDAPVVVIDPEHGIPADHGEGFSGRLLYWICVAFSAFQVVTAFSIPLDRPIVAGLTAIHLTEAVFALWAVWLGVQAARRRVGYDGVLGFLTLLAAFVLVARFTGNPPSQVVRALHVGFLCLVGGSALALHRARSRVDALVLAALAIAGFAVGLYHWAFYEDLVSRSGDMTGPDMVVGIAALVVLFVLVWRFMGPALPIVAGVFLAYCLFGDHLPRPLDHRPYGLAQVIEHMSFGTEGLYATPTLVSATYIFLFILFGAFLERAGMIALFTDVAMGLFGAARGGPAKVAVFSSALMGTISGSGVANVVSTGQFTIPLMKRFGYRAAFAGGVEATASMGGQIMPPVMGAVAFIMAETIDVPYLEIVKAALVPALLYYASAFLAVHLEAGRCGLLGLAREDLPKAGKALAARWYLVLPLAVLVWLLFSGYTPLFAGSVGLALTVLLVIAGSMALGIGSQAIRIVFWVVLGCLAAGSLAVGVTTVLVLVGAAMIVSAFTHGGRETLVLCRDALADGARQALPVGLACAVVGIVVGTMTLTGVGTIFGNWVVSIGKDSLVSSLILTMLVSLVLGMGIPTIPNYIITSSIAAPALLALGVPLIVSHMFVFYFGIMADLTPPVALAAFAAAPIARVSGFRIGFEALRIALPGFVIPFMAVYDPALMLQSHGSAIGVAHWADVAYMIVKALVAVTLWGVASIGFGRAHLTWMERGLAMVAAGFLVAAVSWTDGVGFALAIGVAALHWMRTRGLASTSGAAAR
ncbi:TRAP transporter permease [Pinisolibacter aquiterrae]|uniref:TRAP transporter permease n=1 Tax=Pinisolibacter aquiterrae TaxID=2815579 RepID=UPI001C3C398B|nr:TRAP transporter permease [Pinisolibacter aquiterrae]MBV5264648.1 TRAP transporter permease [Pinisolibacter aquiterrae]MCC8233417.1 TRAP transporter permease [Pinisolibacter aquiterrae]